MTKYSNAILALLLESVFAEKFYKPDIADYSFDKFAQSFFADYQFLRPAISDRSDQKTTVRKLSEYEFRYLRHRGGNHNPVEVS